MLFENDLYGKVNKIQIAINRLKSQKINHIY